MIVLVVVSMMVDDADILLSADGHAHATVQLGRVGDQAEKGRVRD
jgi:hypothetical protein